jgi:hypothetical protein
VQASDRTGGGGADRDDLVAVGTKWSNHQTQRLRLRELGLIEQPILADPR